MLSLRIKLRRDQIKQISSTLADTGLVILASTIVPSFVGELKVEHIIYGAVATLLTWYFSIKFLNYGRN